MFLEGLCFEACVPVAVEMRALRVISRLQRFFQVWEGEERAVGVVPLFS